MAKRADAHLTRGARAVLSDVPLPTVDMPELADLAPASMKQSLSETPDEGLLSSVGLLLSDVDTGFL